MKFSPLYLFVFLFLLTACDLSNKNRTPQKPVEPTERQAIIQEITALDSVPSGSGLVRFPGEYYVISDDSPYLFRLGPDFKVQQKIGILNGLKTTAYRIPKPIKPDYESATLAEIAGEKYLLAFGSGTQTPERDSMLLVPLNAPQNYKTYSLRPFYELLKRAAHLPDSELNVEGSAIIGDNLYLLNRGRNVLVKTNWPRLFIFLKGGPNMLNPEIKTYRVALPKIQNISPGFSGACPFGAENKLLFTASVENTKNWTEDGEILGSYFGILDLDKLENQPLETIALLTDKTGKPVMEKVESVEFLHREKDGTIKALALTDDDLGGSKILRISLPK